MTKTLLRISALFALLALIAWAAGAQEFDGCNWVARNSQGVITGTTAMWCTDDLVLRGTVPIGSRPTPTPAPTYPLDGVFVYQPDPLCPSVGTTIPDLAKAVCMRSKALEYLAIEVGAKRIIPGPKFIACNWAWSSNPAWISCVDYAIRNATPEIRFGMSPFSTRGSIGENEWQGCAAGIAYETYVRISIADLPRSYALAAWEPSNTILVNLLDLRASGDGPIVEAALAYALTKCEAP